MSIRFFKDEWESIIENCGFTDDELEIIHLVRRGWAQIDIAEELCISLSTFSRRFKRIKQKIFRYISNTK